MSSDMIDGGGTPTTELTLSPLQFLQHKHKDILHAVEHRNNLRVFCSKGVLNGGHIKNERDAPLASCEVFNLYTLFLKDIILLFFQIMYTHRHESTVANHDMYAFFFEDEEGSESFVKLRNYTGRSTSEGQSAEIDILYCRKPDKSEMLSVKLRKRN